MGGKASAQTTDLHAVFQASDGLGLARRVKSGEVTPLELAGTAIDAALALDGGLNAVTTPMFERASAKAADMRPRGPFADMPFVVRDNLDIAGQYTTHESGGDGLPIGSHFVAPAGREDLLPSLACEIERAAPWRDMRAPRSLANL